jgi:hypothetical protein
MWCEAPDNPAEDDSLSSQNAPATADTADTAESCRAFLKQGASAESECCGDICRIDWRPVKGNPLRLDRSVRRSDRFYKNKKA